MPTCVSRLLAFSGLLGFSSLLTLTRPLQKQTPPEAGEAITYSFKKPRLLELSRLLGFSRLQNNAKRNGIFKSIETSGFCYLRGKKDARRPR